MTITTSPDISDLSIQVTWDISGTNPAILLVNQSTGNNLAGISWAFTAISPSGTYIVNGDINNPNIVGVWANFTLNNAWPKPFNQIEWSGAPYAFFVVIKDSIGNIITSVTQYTTICRPVGNTQFSTNTYGIANSTVNVSCQQGRVFFQDTTYSTYKGITGTQLSSVLQVMYPIDETGQIPPQFIIGQYSTALVPITYSSPLYQFLQYSVYNYDTGSNTFVNIKYLLLQQFPVLCNVNLLPLSCEIQNLLNNLQNGSCSDMAAAQQVMPIIMGKFCLVVLGIEQPLIGVDVPTLINDIQTLGGFTCNCCGAPTGIIPTTASIIDGYSFSVNKLGGDISPGTDFSITGSNIVLNIGDVSYVVAIGQESPQAVTAFSYTPVVSSDGFTKTYYLNIDGQQLGRDVLNNIANDAVSLNLFAQLVMQTVSASNLQLIVDGGCIFTSTASCDYDFTVSNIPADTTFALLTSLTIGATAMPLSFAFNQTNLSGLQAYLNGLGLGTSTVTNLGSGNVLIAFDNNVNNFTNLTYKISSTSYQGQFARNCTGYIPISANEVVQNIIDYLCGITDAEVVTSQAYVINYINNSGTLQAETINSNTPISTFISAWLTDNLSTVNYILSLIPLNCTNIQAQFTQSSQIMQSNDFVLGTKNGSCARIYPVELGMDILQLGAFDPAFITLFCQLVKICSGGFGCTPFSVFNLSVVDHSPSDNEQDIIVTFTNTDGAFVGAGIEYARIDNTTTPVYTSVGRIAPGASPYTIPNLPEGQYSIGLTAFYSDLRSCPTVYMQTPQCTGVNAFNAMFDGSDIVVTYSVSSPKLRLTITYPNGGTFTQIYNNGDDITVTPPSGVYGNYFATLQPVCNSITGFFGSSSAPAVVSIAQPIGLVTATVPISGLTAGCYIAGIGGIPGFGLSGNLTNGNSQNGTHTEIVSTPISFSVVNPVVSNSEFNGVTINVNGSDVGRVEFSTGNGIYQSANLIIAATDTILLTFNNDA